MKKVLEEPSDKYRVDAKTIEEFDNRYAKGYMTSPRVVERKRIAEVIKSIKLPKVGIALDFGCGKGDFTILLKELLPGWQIVGIDISEVALAKARELYSGINFYSFEEFFNKSDFKFNFIFSHHVLEYVSDLEYAFSQLDRLSNDSCIMLHVIPCGNSGSLEHSIAINVINGINTTNGTYFFEHYAHQKRYTDIEFVSYAEKIGYSFVESWFVDHFWGAIEWITRSNITYLKLISPVGDGNTQIASIKLGLLRMLLYGCYLFRYPYFNYDRVKRKRRWNLLRRIMFWFVRLLYFPSYLFNQFILTIVDSEWSRRKHDPRAGKMYLQFVRK